MSYRITVNNGKATVETDSAEEAQAFMRKMSLQATPTQPVLTRKYKTSKKTTHHRKTRSYHPWVESEVHAAMSHLNEPTRVIARYIPGHSPAAVANFVYNVRKNKKLPENLQKMVDRFRSN